MNKHNKIYIGLIAIILVISYITLTQKEEPRHEIYQCNKLAMGTSGAMCSINTMVE